MDEREGFFSDLRALRAQRGYGLTDIAERTRFPADTLAAAESGPALPPLPALEAYLRGRGEPLTPWEDRWRRLSQVTAGDAGTAAAAREAGTAPAGPRRMAAGPATAATTAPCGHGPQRQPACPFGLDLGIPSAGRCVALHAGGLRADVTRSAWASTRCSAVTPRRFRISPRSPSAGPRPRPAGDARQLPRTGSLAANPGRARAGHDGRAGPGRTWPLSCRGPEPRA
jgi:hypothetical protein